MALQKIDYSRALQEAREKLVLSTTTLESADPRPVFTAALETCPICHNKDWVYNINAKLYVNGGQINSDFGKAYPCPHRRQTLDEQRHYRLQKYCALPDGAQPKTFETYTIPPGNERAYAAALEIVSGAAAFLTLIGHTDLGKTHLAMAICHEYIFTGIPAKFLSCDMFLRELRSSFDGDSQVKYEETFNRACTVPLLVMDDFYQGKRTDWMEQELEGVVNARYLKRLATVFTTNVPLAGMTERIRSRLQRESWCRVVVLGE